eukprot:5448765-Alexandrium_andersonii.AAC.1
MDDADIADIADFGAPAGEEPGGPAWTECSDCQGAGSGAQQFPGDITGAAPPPELVAGVWDVRPIS